MIALDAAAAAAIAAGKRFAALSGRFLPMEALSAEARTDPATAAVVASALAAVCDTNPDGSGQWLIRTAERRNVLGSLARDGGLAAAVQKRRAAHPDPETQQLLDALGGTGEFEGGALDAIMADPAPDRTRIEAIVAAIDRAGAVSPVFARLQQARSALAGIDRTERRAAIEKRGFFGRGDEQAALMAWFVTPFTAPPVKTAFLTGLPGIGKSALLERMVADTDDGFDSIVVRLDFDRAGLNVLDVLRLTMEAARQVADRLGEAGAPLVAARLAAGRVEAGSERSVEVFPTELGAAIGTAVAASHRPVLIVLDTLEVLRSRGETHPLKLFQWLDQLAAAGMQPLRIIAAGRGDALDSCADRIGHLVRLGGLDPAASAAVLERLGAPVEARDAILRIANGNPLVLRLATDVVAGFGVGELPAEAAVDEEVTAAFLYRFLLSRIDDKVLLKLAHPGLIARRLSSAFLREVLGPALGVSMTEAEAQARFAALAAQHWLVDKDPDEPEFVRHRADMRTVLLPLLYRDQPDLCAAIDAAAARWFGKRPGTEAQLDAAYHRLQVMRTRPGSPPKLTAAVAQRIDDTLLAELPEAAQDVVRAAVGGRTRRYRGKPMAGAVADDPAAIGELLGLIERQDWAEGQYVVDQISAAGKFDALGQVAAAITTFRWRAGQWAKARKLLRARDWLAGQTDDDLAKLPPALAVARLEMRGEWTPRLLPGLIADPAVKALIAEAQRQPASLTRQGALGFRLVVPGQHYESIWSERDGDSVAAAIELWTGFGRGQAAFAFKITRERLIARLSGAPLKTVWNDPQVLAALTPYAPFAANLARQRSHAMLEDMALGAEARLLAAGALFVPPVPGIAPLTGNPIASIAGIGLFAEWADVQGFLARDADLRAIGRAAEAWRRTIAGAWAYGPAPPDWRAGEVLDRTLERRIEALADAGNPDAAAHAQLGLWAGDGDGEALAALLHTRIGATLRAAAEIALRDDRARLLVKRQVPAALVPAMTILLANPRPKGLHNG